jgi:3-oxoacyl-[acyl-carrier protein] reductase
VQVKGFFYIVKQLMDQMKQKKKVKFIVISTEYCIGKPPAGLSDYITAKYGLLGLSKCMAVELAQYGSTVNIISPGMVETPLLKGVPSIFKEMNAEQNPFGRIATPKDVTGAILFLASDTSDYLNGTNITVNGGGVML